MKQCGNLTVLATSHKILPVGDIISKKLHFYPASLLGGYSLQIIKGGLFCYGFAAGGRSQTSASGINAPL
jgi:hypothetical protein